MSKKIILFITAILFCLNVLCWKEIFVLAKPGYLTVDFLDVGQGDSAFIQTPEKHQILIDGGPGAAMLGKISQLMPFWDKEIDLVILTHPESDHMQGLLYLLQNYKADYILWSGVKKSAPEYDEWMKILEKQKNMGSKIIIAEAGQEIKAGSVLIDTLYPFESMEGKDMKNTSNDTCVVSKIIFGNNSFIFTGDISSVAEKEIVNSGENVLSDILKVAHHGSKYSTSDIFLSAVKPKIAVISVGAKNTYGHPTPEVLNRLQNFGIKVERTDQQGDVKILSDGNSLKLINN
jgi:competence protein ComEC